MDKADSLLKDIQGLKSEVNVSYPIQNSLPGQAVSKETTRFATFQFTPANTCASKLSCSGSNCVEKSQNMLRGSGGGQETAGWFHFHKVATSGHELYTPPMDMQQVYYQPSLPEMRGGCYPAPDPRAAYQQVPPPAGYADMRPPSQVVNQRFIQCVNHFAPGSRSLPCLLQPSYFGYEYGGPVQGGSDTMLPRVDPCELARSQRYPQHHDWSHIRSGQDQTCYRQPWDYTEQMSQSLPPPRFLDNQPRKGKGFDCQEQKNKDKYGGTSFSYLAAEVSREMQGVIAAGGHALSDLLDFCKFVQSFLFTPTTLSSQRNQLIREVILSFIHVSSAYVHLGSVFLTAEQTGLVHSELETLRASFSLWENTATSVVTALRSLIHTLTDLKPPDHKKLQDMDEQSPFKPDTSSFYPNSSDSPFLNYNIGDNGYRFNNSSRTQHRSDFNFNQQQFEFKRKYQQNNSSSSNSQKENNAVFNNNSTLNLHKSTCLNFKAKSCNQLNVASTNIGNAGGKVRTCEQHCNSIDSSDSDKTKIGENQGIKNFCFNLLNPEKKKVKGKVHCEQERLEKTVTNSKNNKVLEEPSISVSTRDYKEDDKERMDECISRSFKQLTIDSDIPVVSPPTLDNSSTNRLSYLTQNKADDWSFGVLSTGDKRPFQFLSKDTTKNSELKQHSLFSEPLVSHKDPAEKPMSSDSEGSIGGRFSNSELNKATEEHCDMPQIQLKHKMLDILGFLLTPDTHSNTSNSDELIDVKKSLQESLNRISYLVYTDRYGGVGDMMNAVRNLFHKTRVEYMDNPKAVRLADDFESTFLDLFKKEFGYCSILLQQMTGK